MGSRKGIEDVSAWFQVSFGNLENAVTPIPRNDLEEGTEQRRTAAGRLRVIWKIKI
jgi:hypothetical protein